MRKSDRKPAADSESVDEFVLRRNERPSGVIVIAEADITVPGNFAPPLLSA